jgi:hypothetical protein
MMSAVVVIADADRVLGGHSVKTGSHGSGHVRPNASRVIGIRFSGAKAPPSSIWQGEPP